MAYIHPITQQTIPDSLLGVIAPMFTPANEDRSLDLAGLRSYAKWLVENPSVTSLFCRSGVGRMYTYTTEEVKQTLDTVMKISAEKKPVFCCTNGIFDGIFNRKTEPHRYLDETLELSLYAQKRGVSAIVLVVPAGLPIPPRSSEEKIVFEFYKTVHDQTRIPILIYNPQNIPANYTTTPSMIRKVIDLKRILGMKLSTNDMYWMSNLITAAEGKDFFWIAGSECTFYQAMLTGAVGVIGQGCNVYPQVLRRIFDSVLAGDLCAARQAQLDVNLALDGFLGLAPDISGFAYLRKIGLPVSPYCRDGAQPLSDEVVETIFQSLEPICRKYLP